MFNSIRLFSTTSAVAKVAYRKPVAPWYLFRKDNYASVKAANEGAKSQEISKILAEQWKNDSSVRDKYQSIHDAELKKFEDKDPQVAFAVKPEHPYRQFIKNNTKSVANELGTKDTNDVLKVVTKKWNEIPEDEKEAIMKKYKKKLSKFKTEEMKLKGIYRPPTPFIAFSADFRLSDAAIGKSIIETTRDAAKAWSELPSSEKAKYESEYATKLAEYKDKKNALKPERPISRYGAFVKEKFPEVKDANPGVKNSELIKLIAEEWKQEKDYY